MDTWWLFCGGYIDVEYSGLYKGVQMDQRLSIRQVEDVVAFEKFIKSTQGAAGMAWNELFVNGDVVGVDLVAGTANRKDDWLLSFFLL